MSAVPSLSGLEELRRGLSPRSSLPEAARVLLCLQARRLEESFPAALAGEEPAPLHDSRVAGRRLRAGVAMFQCMYPGAWKKAEGWARCATSRFRLARDLDIRCARLRRMMVAAGGYSQEELGLIGGLLEDSVVERKESRGPAVPPVGGNGGRMLLVLWRPRSSRAPEAERFVRVRFRELEQGASLLIPVACEERRGGVQHRLRMRCRALRYSLEMMEWRLGDQAAWRLEILRSVQDELGELHDIDVFRGYIMERAGHPVRPLPKNDGAPKAHRGFEGLGDIGSGLGEERHRLFERFLDIREGLERALAPLNL